LLPDVLELVLRGIPDASILAPAFLREPSKHIELRFIGQAIFVFLSLIPAAISIAATNEIVAGSRCAKISKINQQT
jgi:hypothetical protein